MDSTGGEGAVTRWWWLDGRWFYHPLDYTRGEFHHGYDYQRVYNLVVSLRWFGTIREKVVSSQVGQPVIGIVSLWFGVPESGWFFQSSGVQEDGFDMVGLPEYGLILLGCNYNHCFTVVGTTVF